MGSPASRGGRALAFTIKGWGVDRTWPHVDLPELGRRSFYVINPTLPSVDGLITSCLVGVYLDMYMIHSNAACWILRSVVKHGFYP